MSGHVANGSHSTAGGFDESSMSVPKLEPITALFIRAAHVSKAVHSRYAVVLPAAASSHEAFSSTRLLSVTGAAQPGLGWPLVMRPAL